MLRNRDVVVEGYHGEALGARDLAWIKKQVKERHGLTRRELAVAVCKHFGWRRPGGSYAIEYVNFPHVGQVFRIERTVTRSDGTPLKGNRPRVEVVFGVTSLRPLNARPARILKIVRAHWAAIESGTHLGARRDLRRGPLASSDGHRRQGHGLLLLGPRTGRDPPHRGRRGPRALHRPTSAGPWRVHDC